MRIDILPLCDQHYRTMEFSIAPHNFNYSIEYFRCTDKFCHRCFQRIVGIRDSGQGCATTGFDQPARDATNTAALCSFPVSTANATWSALPVPEEGCRQQL